MVGKCNGDRMYAECSICGWCVEQFGVIKGLVV